MREWKEERLSDAIELIGGGTPRTSVSEYWNGDIPWLSVKDFNNDNRYVYETEKHISESGLEHSSTKMLHRDDIIISARGTVGEMAMIPFPMAFNQSCYGIRGKEGINQTFLYYLVKNSVSKLKKITHGSVFDTITRDTFDNITVSIPDIETQSTVAGILSQYDDKVEQNEQINKNLEEQAQAIFKAWFINFDPFHGIRPNSWKEVSLGAITSLVSRGITPKYVDKSEQIIINQKCIRNHIVDLSLARTHSPKTINEKWLQYGDILINSTGTGTLGRVAQLLFKPHNLTVDSHVTIVRPAQEIYIYYLGLWGTSHELEIEALHTGSTGQTELPRERVKSMQLLLPDKATLRKFNAIIASMTANSIKNQAESHILASLRDALLPKLMSGELDVSSLVI